MVCKILFFDYKKSDKPYFDKNPLDNFCIKFIESSLNDYNKTLQAPEEYENTTAISINSNSNITREVIEKFKNLRVIATRSKDFSHIDIPYCIERNIAVVNVENYKPDCDYYNLSATFKGITAVLCGSKEYRVV